MLDRSTDIRRTAALMDAGVSAPYTVPTRLFEIDKLVSKMTRLVGRDPDVSPAVATLARELQQKSKRALRLAGQANSERARAAAIDLESVIERAEAIVRGDGSQAAPIRAVVGEMRERIHGVTEDLLGNDSE